MIKGPANLCLLTSTSSLDNTLVDIADSLGIDTVRGPLDNLVERTLLAIKKYSPDYILRINGDSPWFPHDAYSQICVELLKARHEKPDVVTSVLSPKRLYGVSVEVVSADCFVHSAKVMTLHKEHILSEIYKSKTLSISSKKLPTDDIFLPSKYSLTVDTLTDLQFNRALFRSDKSTNKHGLLFQHSTHASLISNP